MIPQGNDFKYYHWGPLLYMSTISDEIRKELLERGKKSKDDYRHNLAGHIDDERHFEQDDMEFFIGKNAHIIKDFLNAYNNWRDITESYEINLNSFWINFMKAGEFNPTHTHDGDFSFIVYLQVPKELKEEHDKYKKIGKGAGPGAITFLYGQNEKHFNSVANFFPKENEIYIFPSNLIHYASPFKSDVERVSISGNLILKTLNNDTVGAPNAKINNA